MFQLSHLFCLSCLDSYQAPTGDGRTQHDHCSFSFADIPGNSSSFSLSPVSEASDTSRTASRLIFSILIVGVTVDCGVALLVVLPAWLYQPKSSPLSSYLPSA